LLNHPIELLRNNSTYETSTLISALDFVESFSSSQIEKLITQQIIDKESLQLLVDFIKLVEYRSLQQLNLHHDYSDILKHRFSNYVFSRTHQEYINERIQSIYASFPDRKERSEKTEYELKILRNIFKYTIPRALSLLQDVVNHVYNDSSGSVDFGYLLHLLENSHLSASFSALEEMGVPIQTLEKFYSERLGEASIETLLRYIRRYLIYLAQLDEVDRMFIKDALL
jgi:hypothetical protein